MRKLLIFLSLLALLTLAGQDLEALARVKAVGSIETKHKKPKNEERQQAIDNGKLQGLQKYSSGLDSQRLDILTLLMPDITADLDQYVIEAIELNDGEYSNGSWKINLELVIDDARIEQLIRQRLPKLEEAFISFVFVAREVDAIENAGGAAKAAGSSVIVNSEGIRYKTYNPSDIDSRVTEIFNKAGLEVVPAFEVNITPEQFAFDYASLDEISSSTQKEATDIARSAGLDFLALGMLDIGRENIDPVSGQYRVYAKVSGFIMDLQKKFAVKICSVGPVQYSGLGPNPTVAKTNALIEASTKASQDMVDQLRVKLGM